MNQIRNKKFRAIVAVAMILIGSLPSLAYDFEVDGIYYAITSSEEPYTVNVTFNNENDYSGNIVIPKAVTYNNVEYQVKRIGYRAFFNCQELTDVEIPNSVTSIGYNAFYFCASLTNIEIPNSVISIEERAFRFSGLTSIIIPNSVTSIGDCAFGGCNLTTIVVDENNSIYDSRDNCNAIIETTTNTLIAGCKNTIIPTTITSIGDSAFYYCEELTSIEIPNSVTSIGNNSFECCSALANVTIPSSVISIGSNAFFCCEALTNIIIPDSVTVIEDSAFRQTGLTFVTIPDSLIKIADYAFCHCWNLSDIKIPGSVTFIGKGAFSGCSKLTTIVVDEDNPNYDSRDNCNAIIETATNTLLQGCQNTIIPNSVISIGDYAFMGCRNIENIRIPTSITSIGSSAFNGCYSLKSIEFPSSVISIGDGAFNSCSRLSDIKIPKSVGLIGKDAFSSCRLVNIIVEEGNTNYDSRDNCNAIIETASNTLITGCKNTIIPNTVTSIAEKAFYYCDNELTNIEIPYSVTEIGKDAFWCCSDLKSIWLSSYIKSMGERAFYGCENIEEVYLESDVVPTTWDADVFASILDKSKVILYVPIGSATQYEAASGWSQFNIVEYNYYNNWEIANMEVYKGTTISFPIGMTNENEITAFQCNLRLPEGLSVSQTEGIYDITLSDRKGIDHSLSSTLQQDGSIKILCYSLKTLPFSGNEGELFNIKINVDEEAVGDYEITVSDIILTSTSTKYLPSDVTATLTVRSYMNGDANDDGSIDVMDIVYIAQCILGNPPADFLELAADYNEDGGIDVFDIVNVASFILNQNTAEAGAYALRQIERTDCSLHLVPTISDYPSVTIGIDSFEPYSAYQMDLIIPDGVEITNIISNDTNTHSLMYTTMGNRVRVLCYSATANEFSDNENLMTFYFHRNASCNTSDEILVDNILFSDIYGQGIMAEPMEFRLPSSLAVDKITEDTLVYTENGSIIIESPKSAKAEIIDIAGIVGSYEISEGRNEIQVVEGFYIVRINGKIVKLKI